MPQFNLSLSDYGALSALLLAVMGSQYLIGTAQIEASEARLQGEFALKAQETASALDMLSDKFDETTISISSVVKDGLAARSDEVMTALSSWVKDGDSFTIKLANIPKGSALYTKFSNLASMDGNTAALFTVDAYAIGSLRVADYSDSNALVIKSLLEEAQGQNYDNVNVSFQFSPDNSLINEDQVVEALNLEIETLQQQLDFMGKALK